MLASFALILAVYSNIQGILNPVILAEAQQLTTEVKTQAYYSFMTFIYVIPLLFSLLSFKIYEWSLSHKVNNIKFNTSEWWGDK